MTKQGMIKSSPGCTSYFINSTRTLVKELLSQQLSTSHKYLTNGKLTLIKKPQPFTHTHIYIPRKTEQKYQCFKLAPALTLSKIFNRVQVWKIDLLCQTHVSSVNLDG